MKAEVYSWRVSTELKSDLERAARRRKISMSAVLDLATREWLTRSATEAEGDEEQQRLRQAAEECVGAFASGESYRSENGRHIVRQRLQLKRER